MSRISILCFDAALQGAEYSFVNFAERTAAAELVSLKKVPVGNVVLTVRPKLPPARPHGSRELPLWDLPRVEEKPPSQEQLVALLKDIPGVSHARCCETSQGPMGVLQLNLIHSISSVSSN